jgi:hypothetical protein
MRSRHGASGAQEGDGAAASPRCVSVRIDGSRAQSPWLCVISLPLLRDVPMGACLGSSPGHSPAVTDMTGLVGPGRRTRDPDLRAVRPLVGRLCWDHAGVAA